MPPDHRHLACKEISLRSHGFTSGYAVILLEYEKDDDDCDRGEYIGQRCLPTMEPQTHYQPNLWYSNTLVPTRWVFFFFVSLILINILLSIYLCKVRSTRQREGWKVATTDKGPNDAGCGPRWVSILFFFYANQCLLSIYVRKLQSTRERGGRKAATVEKGPNFA